MTPKWLAAAALLAATAVGSTVASGSASTGPATIRITDRQVVDSYFGDGVGAREIVRSTLYERDGGKHAIGTGAMICTYVAARQRSCTSTFTLPKGTIVASGTLSSRLLYELAIVGGTGLYDNARGTLLDTVIQLRPRRDLLLFRLTG
jgi:hypothetical protein